MKKIPKIGLKWLKFGQKRQKKLKFFSDLSRNFKIANFSNTYHIDEFDPANERFLSLFSYKKITQFISITVFSISTFKNGPNFENYEIFRRISTWAEKCLKIKKLKTNLKIVKVQPISSHYMDF